MSAIPGLFADPVVWVAIWVVTAGILSSLPTRRHHWPLAFALMVPGLPLLAWAWATGPAQGLVATLAGALVLRWPLRRLLGWIAGRIAR